MNDTANNLHAKVELNSDCVCAWCNKCHVVWEATDECGECGSELQPVSYCGGSCYEDAKEQFLGAIKEWQQAENVASFVIQANGMTWQRVTAVSSAVTNDEAALNMMRINGSHILALTWQDSELKVVRYSHDEPTGALFVFVPECDYTNEVCA